MSYPKVVRDRIKVLDAYTENPNLDKFDILHLYPQEIAYPNGYFDSRFFILLGFNTLTREKRNLGKHDGLDFWEECPNIDMARVFCDKSFLIRLREPARMVSNTQAVSFTRE